MTNLVKKNRDGDFKTEKATTAAEKTQKRTRSESEKAKRQNKKKGRK